MEKCVGFKDRQMKSFSFNENRHEFQAKDCFESIPEALLSFFHHFYSSFSI